MGSIVLQLIYYLAISFLLVASIVFLYLCPVASCKYFFAFGVSVDQIFSMNCPFSMFSWFNVLFLLSNHLISDSVLLCHACYFRYLSYWLYWNYLNTIDMFKLNIFLVEVSETLLIYLYLSSIFFISLNCFIAGCFVAYYTCALFVLWR